MKRIAGIAVALGIVVTGCGSGPDTSGTGTASPTGTAEAPPLPPPLVPAMPLPRNAVENAVGKLDRLATELMESSGVPGLAVAVVHKGEKVYAKGFGVKDVRSGDPVDPATVFQIASLSKPISATVVAGQVGAQTISWDTPVVDELPWFALSDPAVTEMVTVGDLFAHRSGLPDHAGDLLEDIGYDRRAVLDRLRQVPLNPFRISYAYTNFGLTAAAEAVAAAAGTPWDQLGQDTIFGPLQMADTSYRFADYEARPNRAVGHIRLADDDYQPRYVRDPDAQSPAGGVSSSVDDLARWLAMVLGEGTVGADTIVESAALLPAITPQVVSSRATEPAMRSGFYGYGFNTGTTSGARTELSHSGAFALGWGSNAMLLPSAEVGIVALTNGTPSGVPEALTSQFADLVQFGEVREPWYELYRAKMADLSAPVGSLVGKQPPDRPAPAQPPSNYAGSYRNEYWGTASVTERDGLLVLGLGPRGDTFVLTHWDGNVFTFEMVTENAAPGTISTATFDGDRLTLEFFDQHGNGVFTK